MRAGANAGVIAIAPISEIVAAFGAGSGIVGDFISEEPEPRRFLGGCVIECCGVLRVGQDDVAAGVGGLEGGAGFDGELIERKMIGGESQRPP